MSGRITTVSKPPKLERKKRVAAYARVSSGKDAMLHSLSAQVSHYSDLIQRNGDWLYAGVYEALTERYEKAAAELERLQNLRTTKSQKDKAMALYIRTLKKQPVVLREWSDTIWTVMVEKALVHRNGEITFVFKNGTEVKVGE